MSDEEEYRQEYLEMLDNKALKVEFQIIHEQDIAISTISEIFAKIFTEIIEPYGYYDYLKEQTCSYLNENGHFGFFGNGDLAYELETSDINSEQVADYVESMLADEYDVFQEISTYKIKNNYITNLTMNFRVLNEVFSTPQDLEEYSDLLIEDFISGLRDKLNNPTIIKFADVRVKDRYKTYYSEIYDLEMQLRKVLTYIFVNEYDAPFELLKDYELLIPKDNKKDKTYFEKHLENEFFMLCFSDYLKICTAQVNNTIKHSDLINFVKEAFSFEEFKNKLFLGIKEQKHIDFLASIKQDLNSIEEMRNAIMHGRTYSKDILDYERSKTQLQNKIDSFWKDLQISIGEINKEKEG